MLEALLTFLTLFCALGGFCCILYISQEYSGKNRVDTQPWKKEDRDEKMKLLTASLSEYDSFTRMKEDDPQKYIQTLKELVRKQTISDQDAEDKSTEDGL